MVCVCYDCWLLLVCRRLVVLLVQLLCLFIIILLIVLFCWVCVLSGCWISSVGVVVRCVCVSLWLRVASLLCLCFMVVIWLISCGFGVLIVAVVLCGLLLLGCI